MSVFSEGEAFVVVQIGNVSCMCVVYLFVGCLFSNKSRGRDTIAIRKIRPCNTIGCCESAAVAVVAVAAALVVPGEDEDDVDDGTFYFRFRLRSKTTTSEVVAAGTFDAAKFSPDSTIRDAADRVVVVAAVAVAAQSPDRTKAG